MQNPLDQQNSTPEWFVGEQPLTAKPKKSHKLLYFFGGTTALLAVILMILTFTTTCLTADDYQTFYGSEPDSAEQFTPGNAFFTGTYEFQPDSTTINTSESDSPATDIENLAAFYKAHTHRRLVFTVSAEYNTAAPGSKLIAEQRVASLKKQLLAAGIPNELVSSSVTSYTPQLGSDADMPGSSDLASISLSSSEICR